MLRWKKIKTEDLDHSSDNIWKILLLSATSDSIKIVSSMSTPEVVQLDAPLSS